MNWFKKNKEVELSFYNWVLCQNYGWKWKYLKQVGHNPIFMMYAHLCLYFDWFNKDGSFKKGDKVKYNFFARTCIPGICKVDSGEIVTFTGYPEWSTSKSSCEWVDEKGEEGSCAAFWLKKVRTPKSEIE